MISARFQLTKVTTDFRLLAVVRGGYGDGHRPRFPAYEKLQEAKWLVENNRLVDNAAVPQCDTSLRNG